MTRADGASGGAGIIAVTGGGPADQGGLRAGDVIQAAGRTRTPRRPAVSGTGRRTPGEQHATLTATRATQHLTVNVTLGELPGS